MKLLVRKATAALSKAITQAKRADRRGTLTGACPIDLRSAPADVRDLLVTVGHQL